MGVYHLISKNMVEERVLARARQKMVLDGLVVKDRGSDGGLTDAVVEEGDAEEELTKLSVEELWNMLSKGAEKVFDPAVDKAEDFDAKDYDHLICEAKPAKWDDKTGIDEKLAVEGCNQSDLDGTIFAPGQQESKGEVIDLLSSCDKSVSGIPITSHHVWTQVYQMKIRQKS